MIRKIYKDIYENGTTYIRRWSNRFIISSYKPINFLWKNPKDIKIGVFGISAARRKRGELNTLTIGKAQYMIPEMSTNRGYDYKIDGYVLRCSFRILCYFLFQKKCNV